MYGATGNSGEALSRQGESAPRTRGASSSMLTPHPIASSAPPTGKGIPPTDPLLPALNSILRQSHIPLREMLFCGILLL